MRPTLKFTILVDLDDVMENLCQVWIQCLNERHKTNVAIDDIKEWNIAAAFPSLSKEDIIAPLRTEELWRQVRPLPGAVEYLKRLISDGH